MRIIQLIQKLELRGAQIFACQLGNHLKDSGNSVRLLSLFDGQEQLPFQGDMVNLRLSLNKRFFDLAGWRRLAKEVQEFDAAVIQANAGDTLKYAVLSKLFFRWKAPIVFRNASVISRYIKSPIIMAWNAWLFKHVDYVVSVSEESRNDFVKLFPFMKNKIQVIPIGIDLIPLPEIRPVQEKYILHVGGFTFEKNHERLLHIFKNILVHYPDFTLWLVGDGPLRSAVEKQAATMDLGNSIRFLGFRNDVLSLLQQAQVFVLPSIIEGLPGVILEAMYCKTPVVAYDVGGIREVLKNEETGWLVKAGNELEFVNAVLEVLQGGDEAVIENAFDKVKANFDNREIAKRFLKIYEQIQI